MRPLCLLLSVGLVAGCKASPPQCFPPVDGNLDAPFPAFAPLPALTGGTLLVAAGGQRAVASDPDRDAVWVVDMDSANALARFQFEAGAQPGRLTEDAEGRVHVV